MKKVLLIAILALVASPAMAQEETFKLKDGPGKEQVEENCGACHSLEYIGMNSPFLDRAKWDATIKKMVNLLGAPIQDKDVPAILDYLVKNYGG
jgi:cytochrome c5